MWIILFEYLVNKEIKVHIYRFTEESWAIVKEKLKGKY